MGRVRLGAITKKKLQRVIQTISYFQWFVYTSLMAVAPRLPLEANGTRPNHTQLASQSSNRSESLAYCTNTLSRGSCHLVGYGVLLELRCDGAGANKSYFRISQTAKVVGEIHSILT